MTAQKKFVNLDAMIIREDFATTEDKNTYEQIQGIHAREFTSDGFIGKLLRKPDFQRETNQWSPEQIASFLECFVNGDLIPSVILWKSSSYIFVIDGGHRLSALKAWIEDDYGDGTTSYTYFGRNIPQEQMKIAQITRALVNEKVKSWSQFQTLKNSSVLSDNDRAQVTTVGTRTIPIQWVSGDIDKAEASFFKINTKGTALDDIEELLLLNRKKPIAIAARAIIRAGSGHKYWSAFPEDITPKIESTAKRIHELLFDPEVKHPIKSLDLPLGGPKTTRGAIQELIDLVLIASRDQQGNPKEIKATSDDSQGEQTLTVLAKTHRLISQMTGNDNGSLGLHPALYFYGPKGRHISAMFLGTATLIASALINNNSAFFKKFIKVRSQLETVLIKNKDLISAIIQKTTNKRRASLYSDFLRKLIDKIDSNTEIRGFKFKVQHPVLGYWRLLKKLHRVS